MTGTFNERATRSAAPRTSCRTSAGCSTAPTRRCRRSSATRSASTTPSPTSPASSSRTSSSLRDVVAVVQHGDKGAPHQRRDGAEDHRLRRRRPPPAAPARQELYGDIDERARPRRRRLPALAQTPRPSVTPQRRRTTCSTCGSPQATLHRDDDRRDLEPEVAPKGLRPCTASTASRPVRGPLRRAGQAAARHPSRTSMAVEARRPRAWQCRSRTATLERVTECRRSSTSTANPPPRR